MEGQVWGFMPGIGSQQRQHGDGRIGWLKAMPWCRLGLVG